MGGIMLLTLKKISLSMFICRCFKNFPFLNNVFLNTNFKKYSLQFFFRIFFRIFVNICFFYNSWKIHEDKNHEKWWHFFLTFLHIARVESALLNAIAWQKKIKKIKNKRKIIETNVNHHELICHTRVSNWNKQTKRNKELLLT